jgi:hypothetical protein
MKKTFYKKLSNYIDDIKKYKNSKGPKKISILKEKIKKPFVFIKKSSIPEKEKNKLVNTLIIILSTLLGISFTGFAISQGIKKNDTKKGDEIQKFKDDITNAPPVSGVGRKIYEKMSKLKDEATEIIKINFPPGFGTDFKRGIGYDRYIGMDTPKIGEPSSFGKIKWPSITQENVLKKLGIDIKYFQK